MDAIKKSVEDLEKIIEEKIALRDAATFTIERLVLVSEISGLMKAKEIILQNMQDETDAFLAKLYREMDEKNREYALKNQTK